MAQICFFTNVDSLKDQEQHQSFGVIDDSNYRIASKHSSLDGKISSAFAICSGQVRYQNVNGDNDLLNIILKPNNLKSETGLPIQYIIYRGIQKNSVVGQETIKELINYPPTDKNNNNDEFKLGLCFKSDGIGEYKRGDEDFIDTIFYVTTECKTINVGANRYLGQFDNEFSIQIILGGLGYRPTLGFVRDNLSVEYNIPNGWGDLEQRISRERVLNFLDPCAFYGTFYHEKKILDLELFSPKIQMPETPDNGVINLDNIKYSKIKRKDIYTNILLKAFSKNCNKIYIDVRNEIGFSLHLYKNYSHSNINISLNEEGNLHEFSYSNKWPIFVLDAARFNSISPPISGKNSVIRIALPIEDVSNTKNDARYLYYSKALILSSVKSKSLLNPLDNKKIKRIDSLYKVGDSPWSNEIICSTLFHVVDENVSIVSSYIKLQYYDKAKPQNNEFSPKHYFDFIFMLKKWDDLYLNKYDISAASPPSMRTQCYLTDHEVFIDFQKTAYSPFKKFSSLDSEIVGVVNTGVAIDYDGERVSFIAIITEAIGLDLGIRKSPVCYDGLKSFFQDYQNNAGDLKVKKRLIDLGTGNDKFTLEFIPIENKNNEIQNDKYAFLSVSFTMEEYEQIYQNNYDSFDDELKHPVFFVVENHSVYQDNKKKDFYDLCLSLIGYNSNLNIEISEGISEVYSKDNFLYCTSDAAYMENVEFLDFDLKDRLTILTAIPNKNGEVNEEAYKYSDSKEYSIESDEINKALDNIFQNSVDVRQKLENLVFNGFKLYVKDKLGGLDVERQVFPKIRIFYSDKIIDGFGGLTVTESGRPRFDLFNISKEIFNAYKEKYKTYDKALTSAPEPNFYDTTTSVSNEDFVFSPLMYDRNNKKLFKEIDNSMVYFVADENIIKNPPEYKGVVKESDIYYYIINIKINVNIRIPKLPTSPPQDNKYYLSTDDFEIYKDAKQIFKKGVNPRSLSLIKILSHELGHAVYNAQNPLWRIIWSGIQSALNPDEKGVEIKGVYYKINNYQPYFLPGTLGHVKGDRGAKMACEFEKNTVQKYFESVFIKSELENDVKKLSSNGDQVNNINYAIYAKGVNDSIESILNDFTTCTTCSLNVNDCKYDLSKYKIDTTP